MEVDVAASLVGHMRAKVAACKEIITSNDRLTDDAVPVGFVLGLEGLLQDSGDVL